MSHFAKVNNGIVEQVIVAEQDFIDNLKDTTPGNWIQTSYNTLHNQHPNGTPLRGNFAGIGYIYDFQNDVFYPPQPFQSWILNKTLWKWEAPTPLPNDANTVAYSWNEETTSWEQINDNV